MKENAPKKTWFQTLRTLWLPLAIGIVTVAALLLQPVRTDSASTPARAAARTFLNSFIRNPSSIKISFV